MFNDSWDITLAKYFWTPLSLLPSLPPSSKSVIFTGPCGTKLGRNIYWMVLYILFSTGNSQIKKRSQGGINCFVFLYVEIFVLHKFWWLFLHVSYQNTCMSTRLLVLSILLSWLLQDGCCWHQIFSNKIVSFYTLWLNCSVYFMKGSFIFIGDFFLFAQPRRYFIIQLKMRSYFFLLKMIQNSYVLHIYLYQKLLILTSC